MEIVLLVILALAAVTLAVGLRQGRGLAEAFTAAVALAATAAPAGAVSDRDGAAPEETATAPYLGKRSSSATRTST